MATAKKKDTVSMEDAVKHYHEIIYSTSAQIAELSAEKKRAEFELAELVAADISEKLKGKDYGCGTANIEYGEFTIKAVVSKKVTWDTQKLESLYTEIQQGGEDPSEYIKTSYSVSESAYNGWPSVIKQAFEPARTVEPSKPKITVEMKGK